MSIFDTGIDSAASRKAQDELFDRLSLWLTAFSDLPGFRDWKNHQLRRTLLVGFGLESDAEQPDDFDPPAKIRAEHEIVTGYYTVLRSLINVRECEFYFRRYPFKGKNVSREAHLRSACELFFSRVYQFRERWIRQLKRVARRTKLRDFPADSLLDQFNKRFKSVLEARHLLHHEKDYSDLELDAIGVGDMLATASTELEWTRISQGSYRRISNGWVKKVRQVADELDVFVGVIAILMIARCKFLSEAAEVKN